MTIPSESLIRAFRHHDEIEREHRRRAWRNAAYLLSALLVAAVVVYSLCGAG